MLSFFFPVSKTLLFQTKHNGCESTLRSHKPVSSLPQVVGITITALFFSFALSFFGSFICLCLLRHLHFLCCFPLCHLLSFLSHVLFFCPFLFPFSNFFCSFTFHCFLLLLNPSFDFFLFPFSLVSFLFSPARSLSPGALE